MNNTTRNSALALVFMFVSLFFYGYWDRTYREPLRVQERLDTQEYEKRIKEAEAKLETAVKELQESRDVQNDPTLKTLTGIDAVLAKAKQATEEAAQKTPIQYANEAKTLDEYLSRNEDFYFYQGVDWDDMNGAMVVGVIEVNMTTTERQAEEIIESAMDWLIKDLKDGLSSQSETGRGYVLRVDDFRGEVIIEGTKYPHERSISFSNPF